LHCKACRKAGQRAANTVLGALHAPRHVLRPLPRLLAGNKSVAGVCSRVAIRGTLPLHAGCHATSASCPLGVHAKRTHVRSAPCGPVRRTGLVAASSGELASPHCAHSHQLCWGACAASAYPGVLKPYIRLKGSSLAPPGVADSDGRCSRFFLEAGKAQTCSLPPVAARCALFSAKRRASG